MNEKILKIIISRNGMRLIQALPSKPSQALGIMPLSKKAKVPITSAYRIMKILSKWSNIKIIYNANVIYSQRLVDLYYIKNPNFTIKFTKKKTILKIDIK